MYVMYVYVNNTFSIPFTMSHPMPKVQPAVSSKCRYQKKANCNYTQACPNKPEGIYCASRSEEARSKNQKQRTTESTKQAEVETNKKDQVKDSR